MSTIETKITDDTGRRVTITSKTNGSAAKFEDASDRSHPDNIQNKLKS